MTGTSRPEPRIPFDREKFIEAIHEIIARCSGEPERLGVERLHRALYYTDMLAYLDRSEPVTGVEYIRETFGPAARYLDWAVNELQARNLVSGYADHILRNSKDKLRLGAARSSTDEQAVVL